LIGSNLPYNPNTRTPKPKTHKHPPFLGGVDIYIPSLHISPTSDGSKFFLGEIVPKIFPSVNSAENFSQQIGENK
jgi:hypothetical protein